MTTLLLVRHGETEWNRTGRWQGHADVPLSDEGRDQARRLARRLKSERERIDRVYASDLGRAFETAEIVAAELALPVHPLIELREIHIGSWSGLTSDQIRSQFPHEWQLHETGDDFRRGGHGETMADFRSRVGRAAEELVQQHPGERLLLVTHGGAIRALLYYVSLRAVQVEEARVENTSLTEVVFEEDAVRVVRVNDIAHLERLAETNTPARV